MSIIEYIGLGLVSLVILGGFIFIFISFWFLFTEVLTKNKVCEWQEIDVSIYKTGCYHKFYNADDAHYVGDWLNYCPYCSGKVSIKEGLCHTQE